MAFFLNDILKRIMFDITDERKRGYKIKLLELLFVMSSIVGGISTRSVTKPMLAGFVMFSIYYYLILTKDTTSVDEWLPFVLAIITSAVALTASLLLITLMTVDLQIKEGFSISFWLLFPIIFMGLYSDLSVFEKHSVRITHSTRRGK